MTTVYVPVPITSVEQAEALPDDAILFDVDIADGCIYYHDRDSGEWYVDGYPGTLSRAIQFGCTVTALVPVEAEEQWGARDKAGGVTRPSAGIPAPHAALEDHIRVRATTGQHDSLVRRLVTPWERMGA